GAVRGADEETDLAMDDFVARGGADPDREWESAGTPRPAHPLKRSRFVRPEAVTIPLTDGDWIIVRRRLNTAETREMFTRRYEFGPDNLPRVNLRQVGVSKVTAYLIDWSFPELPIRGVTITELEAALGKLEPEDFAEIQTAIEEHEFLQEQEREAQKKTASGAPSF